MTVSRMDRGARKDAAGTPDMLACGEEMALVQPRFRARHEAVAVADTRHSPDVPNVLYTVIIVILSAFA